MKIDTIKAELKQLNTAVEDLQKKLSELYGDELPQEPKKLSKGLRFKTDTDLFTAEEQELNKELDSTIISSMRLEQTLSEELSKITRAQHDRESYYSSLYSRADLVTLYRETDETLQQAETLSKTLGTLSRSVQNIAYSRYFDRLTDRRGKGDKAGKLRALHSEIKTIAEGADTKTTDGEPIRVGGFTVIDNRGDSFTEKLSQLFEAIQAVNLLCYYHNGYYELHYSTILPTNYQDITADKQKAFIRELIEPCFKSHLEAIRALPYPTKEAEKYINDTIERIYKDLNLTLEGGADEADIQNIIRNPVANMLLPHTQITRLMRDEGFRYGEKKSIQEFKTKNKPINSYMTVTALGDLKGVEGRKLSFEEIGICVSAYNELMAGNEYVTTQMLYKTWAGGDSKTRLKKEQKEKKEELINTLRQEEQRIDQREYKKQKHLKEDFITDRILDVAIAEGVTINGQYQEKCWKIKGVSPFIQHAINLGQVTTIPTSHLNIGLPMTYYPLRDYLYDEIHRIKGDIFNTETEAERAERLKTEARLKAQAEAEGKKYKPRQQRQKPTILFDTIYEKVYNGTKDKRTHRGIQKASQQILTYWKKVGIIKDYKLLYNGVNGSAPKKHRKTEKIADDAYGIEIDVRKAEPMLESPKRG